MNNYDPNHDINNEEIPEAPPTRKEMFSMILGGYMAFLPFLGGLLLVFLIVFLLFGL